MLLFFLRLGGVSQSAAKHTTSLSILSIFNFFLTLSFIFLSILSDLSISIPSSFSLVFLIFLFLLGLTFSYVEEKL